MAAKKRGGDGMNLNWEIGGRNASNAGMSPAFHVILGNTKHSAFIYVKKRSVKVFFGFVSNVYHVQ